MKLKFIGRGGAFAPVSIGNSNIMLTSDTGKRLMIDFGSTAPYIYRDELGLDFKDIDAMWISHLHADHCNLEMFAFSRYFIPKKDEKGQIVRPKLFMIRSLMKEMWESTLRGGLESLQGKIMNLTDYFDCKAVKENGSFKWENISFTPVQTVHIRSGYVIKHSYGLFIEAGKIKIYQTSDTQFDLGLLPFYNAADIIFQDCETGTHHSIVHAHYDDLKTLSADIRKKMWLYHHNQKEKSDDGFAGFIEKGQEFEL